MDNKFWKNFRIGVFMGGPSCEHDVSLNSGDAVYRALREEGLNAIPIKLPRDLDTGYTGIAELLKQIFAEEKINLVFNSLHGKFGEDGKLQRILDKLGIAYTGSKAEASYLAMDKIASRKIFEAGRINLPRYIVLSKLNSQELAFPFPVVVKPSRGGSSIGVSVVNREEDLAEAVKSAFAYDMRVIIEEYIRGKEITVGVIADSPLPVIQIVPKREFYDYRAKYEDRRTDYVLPAPIARDLQKRAQTQAIRAHRLLGCSSFSRIDMILNREGVPVLLEVNTIPGLTKRSLLPKAAQAAGISFNQMCLKMLDSAFCK